MSAGSGRVAKIPALSPTARPILPAQRAPDHPRSSQPPATNQLILLPRPALECALSWNETRSCHTLESGRDMIWLYRTVVVVAWQASRRRRRPGGSGDSRQLGIAGDAYIPVVSDASSALAAAGGQYAPARATDGDRHTKWVASVAPSQSDPQWIILQLAGSQAVSAVAVFGERIDNDGILDAQVQAAGSKPGEFTAVATIADAKSGSWLATFDAVKTTAIRVRITRSGGPSPHTDVYEIELYGPPIPPAELKAYAKVGLDGCRLRWKEVAALAEKLGLKTDPQLAALRGVVDSSDRAQRQLADRFSQWDSLDQSSRQSLAADIERLQARAGRTLQGLGKAAAIWPERAKDIAAARQAARPSPGEAVAATRDGGQVRLANSRVSVVLHQADGAWDATWLGSVDAAVRRVQFAVEVDRQSLSPEKAEAAAAPFTDAIGSGVEICQRWGKGIEVVRRIRVYDGRPAVVISAQIANHTGRDVMLGTAKMLGLSQGNQGWWHLGNLLRAPAAVGYPGASPPCRPAPGEEPLAAAGQQYGSSGVLALAQQESPGGLVLGALSARESSPSVRAGFQTGLGGTSLEAALNVGSALGPGQTITLDPVWLSVEEDRYGALERYGDAAAVLAPQPARTGANALWCSWYPIRMGISEEIALAHAAIAAEHFRPLGLDVIQLDHGWQRGDICGDWFPNERFPHGLKWLSEQLHSRYGMKLGLWIAPTNVAFTSQLFRDHPDWLIKDSDGRPAATGRWFWAPNPDMTLLDAACPGAEKWIEETFARLSSRGPATTRSTSSPARRPASRDGGDSSRRRAGRMGPLLPDAALAVSRPGRQRYIGIDTGDAGLANWIRVERDNAPLLAASYWVNDRLYHREVCDMSVGTKASVEEARFKLSLMTLSGCSISFSDDFRLLEPPRIRMMQQCLPPGNPPARPLDLFEREMPSLWHMHCSGAAGEWDAVGLFNFEDQPQERTVELSSLGLPAAAEVAVFEFWEEKFLGSHRDRVTLVMAPRTARILLIHRLPTRPEVIATNMHVLGGYHEIERLAWDERGLALTGRCRRMPGVSGRVYFYVPDGYRPHCDPARPPAFPLAHAGGPLWSVDLAFDKAEVEFSVAFDRSQRSRYPPSAARRLVICSIKRPSLREYGWRRERPGGRKKA